MIQKIKDQTIRGKNAAMSFYARLDKRQRMIFFAAVIALAVAIFGISMRVIASIQLRHLTQKQAVLNVAVIEASAAPTLEDIVLPGNVQAWHEATIYARVDGYIKKWDTDIGAHVKEGQLLAEIEAPELDAQLRQAQADLITAQANNELAQVTAKRWIALLKTDSVSKQETDEKIGAAQANAALVNAAQANVDRLQQLVGFEKIVAPFDGVITSRTTDIGSLINSGSGNSLKPLFHIVQADPLRIYVRVPQNYAVDIKPGLIVELYFSEHPGEKYLAKLLDTANAIDPVSRTLLTQFEIGNSDNQLFPGSYTEVHLQLPTKPGAVILPVNALLFRSEGLRVGILDDQNHVILKAVKISRDFGDKVEIDSGLTAGQKVIINPSDSLYNGEAVNIVKSPSHKKDDKQ